MLCSKKELKRASIIIIIIIIIIILMNDLYQTVPVTVSRSLRNDFNEAVKSQLQLVSVIYSSCENSPRQNNIIPKHAN